MTQAESHRKQATEAAEKSEAAFWELVDFAGYVDGKCWLWKGAVGGGGYGQLTRARKRVRAHRFSWMVSYGPIPDDLYVLHHCDNRLCVRPSHLFLGTQTDNMGDAKAKGRLNTSGLLKDGCALARSVLAQRREKAGL